MPMPEFLVGIRAMVGRELLFMIGVSGVVVDDDGRVLLHLRADDGRWSTPGGIVEPGEQPADALVREVEEETGVQVVPERISSVRTEEPITYPNGDRAQFLDVAFRCRPIGGEPRPDGDESLDVRWFSPDALPDLPRRIRERLRWGLLEDDGAWFHREEHPRQPH